MKFNKNRLRKIRKKGQKVVIKKSVFVGGKGVSVAKRVKQDKRVIKVNKVVRKKAKESFKDPAKKLGFNKVKQKRNGIGFVETLQNNIVNTYEDTVDYVKSYF